MAYTQKFAKFLPVAISFFKGESASPQKFNGIFSYLEAGFSILESFLGNGIDYKIPLSDKSKRKMLFNVSQAIGSTSNIYKPVNKMVSLSNIYHNYGSVNNGSTTSHESHSFIDNINKKLIVNRTLNVPLCITNNQLDTYYLGVYYTGDSDGEISIKCKTVGENITLSLDTNPGRKFGYIKTNSQYIEYIEIKPKNGKNIEIESIFFVSNSETTPIEEITNVNNKEMKRFIAFNSSYSVPIINKSLWTIKLPCENALKGICTLATCGYCIGNLYDVNVNSTVIDKIGAPVCGGDDGIFGNIEDELIPKNITTKKRIKYIPNDYNTTGSVPIYTIQSPVLTEDVPYMIKFMPFIAHQFGYSSGQMLVKNESAVYDIASPKSPVFTNMTIYSAGQPHIVYVVDDNLELSGGFSDRILILGGLYSLSDFVKDSLKVNSEGSIPQVSVYAD